MAQGEKRFKVVLLGEGCVGKTSLFLRFTKNEFNDEHETTLQASYQNKRINLPDGRRANLALWDTAGQERFHSLGPIYYRDSNGAILVYDITDKNSFTRVQNWVKELRKMLGKEIILVIAGNKCDLEKQRVVSQAEAEQYAKDVGAHHFLTSAKQNKGITEMILNLTTRMMENDKSDDADNLMIRRPSTRKGLIIDGADADAPAQQSESGCAC